MNTPSPRFFAFTLVLVSADSKRTNLEDDVIRSASKGDLFGCQPNFHGHPTTSINHGRSPSSFPAYELSGHIGLTPETSEQPARSAAQNMLALMSRLATVLQVRCQLHEFEGFNVEDVQKEHSEAMREASLPATVRSTPAAAAVLGDPGCQLNSAGSGVRLVSNP